jgi:hypothetical protein
VSTQVRVYDDAQDDGQPVVVMVARGTFDVPRLAYLMSCGRCEDVERAGFIVRALRRHNGGRAALKVLRDHGGPDLLEDVPAEPDGLLGLIHRAAADPGQFVERNLTVATDDICDWDYEPVPHWSARAVVAARAAHFTVLPDQVKPLRPVRHRGRRGRDQLRRGLHRHRVPVASRRGPGATDHATLGELIAAAFSHTGLAADRAHAEWLADVGQMDAAGRAAVAEPARLARAKE